MTLNPAEAPKGYEAHPEFPRGRDPCRGCAFSSGTGADDDCTRMKDEPRCVGYARTDGCDVIFKKIKTGPKVGTTYRIVKLELLVPTGAEDYMDLLSDFRDDNPDELVQWSHAPHTVEGLSRVAAIAAWACLHPDDQTITIKEGA